MLDLRLTLRTQSTLGDLVQVIRDLHLHIIRDVLVLLDAGEELIEILALLRVQQLRHEAEHLMATGGEDIHLLLSLQDGELGSGEQTATDVGEAGLVLLRVRLRSDDLAHQTFQRLDEPYQDQHVTYVEGGMESGQHDRQDRLVLRLRMRVATHQPADEIDEMREDGEDPYHTEHVEDHVRHRGTSGLRGSGERHHIGSDRRTDVLTHHQGDTHVDVQHTRRTERHGDGHDGGGALHGAGQHASDE